MRFSVAAMTLAASGTPAASSDNLVGSNAVVDQQRFSSFRQLQSLMKAQAMGGKFRQHGAGHFTHGLAGKHPLKNGEKKLCMPNAQSASTIEGDFLGILSCGPREYCAENETSSLGGFCEPVTGTRSLQNDECVYWNPIDSCIGGVTFCDSQGENYSCDCGMVTVNGANSSGLLSCQLPYFCEEDTGDESGFAPCPDTCWEVKSNFEFVPNELGLRDYSAVTCHVFSSPYNQVFCRGESGYVVDGVLQNFCNMSLNGEYCTSCSVGTFSGSPESNPDFFDAWDCTNIGLSASPEGEFAFRFSVQPPLFSPTANCSRADAPVPTLAPSAVGTPTTTTAAPVTPIDIDSTTPAPSPVSSASLNNVSLLAMGAAAGAWLSTVF